MQQRILIFYKTVTFYHESIPIGIQALLDMAESEGIEADTTVDAGLFTDDRLATYAAVIFLNTTGDVLDEAQQTAFQSYIRGGGGYVGIHAASDTEHDWSWYGEMVGAYFVNHPRIQEARLEVVDHDHPSTSDLPGEWIRTDEWYNLRYMNDEVNVLVTLDETSYLQRNGEAGSAYHPHSWYHVFEGGRVFYTAMGHTDESYAEPGFLSHIRGALRWAMGPESEGSSE
jgi:type 1 glutamine amidotransferase